MPLMSFSTLKSALQSGNKRQTTRLPRKRPLKVGDTLYVYFKSRAKKTCDNCLTMHCILDHCIPLAEQGECKNHKNKFGNAVITDIKTGHFITLTDRELHAWAERDGFYDFDHANKWFFDAYGARWMHMEWTVITFEPDWVK